MSLEIVLLVVLSLAFAWSMGAHYTGAVMGMPYASHSIRMWPALVSLSVLTLVGATFASQGVQRTARADHRRVGAALPFTSASSWTARPRPRGEPDRSAHAGRLAACATGVSKRMWTSRAKYSTPLRLRAPGASELALYATHMTAVSAALLTTCR